MKKIGILAIILGLFFTSIAFSAGQPSFKKVILIVLENENAENALSKPFLKSLTEKGTYLSNYRAIRHPSQPNYLALVSGSTHHIKDDSNVTVVGQHIGDLLDAKGMSWKNYAEGYPGGCNLSKSIGKYARKHVPFLSFNNIQVNNARCAQHIVPAEEFDKDVASGNLPDFSFYTPDENNDGHDTGVAYADQWLKKRFGALLEDPKFMQDLLFVVTFDEGTYFSSNRVYTVLLGSEIKAGVKLTDAYNHYSLLRTIEDGLNIGSLEMGDRDARPILLNGN